MTLRTVNPYTSYSVMLDFQRVKAQLTDLQTQLASGNRLTSIGTDPTASALVLDFQNSIDTNKNYIKQAETAATFVQSTETTLSALNESITRLLELAPQAQSTNLTAAGRAALAQEIDGIRSTILSLSNTQSQGKYIFAGTMTTTAPFSGPSAGPIVYNGNDGLIDFDISAGATVITNITGRNAFFGGGAQGSATDLFQQVTDLRDGLNTNNAALINSAVTNLKTIHTNVNTMMTDLGGRERYLNQMVENMKDYNISLQTIQGSYQDLDYPEAITDYYQAQTAQQASLSVMAKSNNLNLFNYIG